MSRREAAHRTGPLIQAGGRNLSTPPTTRASIEPLHRELAALAEDMRSPAPTAIQAILLPFGLGVALALVTIVVVAWMARLL
jgi:hypothetical protein